MQAATSESFAGEVVLPVSNYKTFATVEKLPMLHRRQWLRGRYEV